MNIARTSVGGATGAQRSVQSYIDEAPVWSDGTALRSTPMTGMQWLIWTLAAFGKFFEGLVVFMTGVALPLISQEFGLGKADHGVIGAASLAGILVGAIGLGGLSDFFGRKRMFVIEMFIFLAFLCLLVVSPNYPLLVLFLFGLGVALGCDYPTAHVMISESIPSSMRGRLILGAFGFQALGALTGTVIAYVVLKNVPDIGAWRWMYALAVIPALIVAVARFWVTESAHWLLTRGRKPEAETEMKRLLNREPTYPKALNLVEPPTAARDKRSFAELFARPTGARRSSPPSPGSSKTSAPTASASSPRPFSPTRSATRWRTSAISPTSSTTTNWRRAARASSTSC